MTITSISATLPRYQVGSPCSKRRYGCIGHVRDKLVKHRNAEGKLSNRRVLVCDRCGQAHGPSLFA